MARFDELGSSVGGTAHDAATMTAALIAAGKVTTVEEAAATFDTLHAKCFDSFLRLKGANAIAEVFTQDRPSGGEAGDDCGSVKLKWGQYAGSTLAEVYEAHGADALSMLMESARSPWLIDKIQTFLSSK